MSNPESKGWQEYYEKTKERPPRPLLVKAVSLINGRDEALDLGAAALNNTKYLLSEGFKHVTALDKERLADDIVAELPADKVEYVISTFEDFEFSENEYDIVNAQYALPFNPPDTFKEVFSKIKRALKPNGIFVGQLFGVNDEWNTAEKRMSFHSKEDVAELLSDMEVVELNEEEKDEKPIVGDVKHWHVFHIIARKTVK